MPELSIQLLCNSRYFSGFSVISVTPLHGGLSQRLYQVQYRNDDELKSVVVRCIQDAQLARAESEFMQHAMDLAPRLRTIEDVDIDVVWEPPWGPDKMTEEAKLELGFDI